MDSNIARFVAILALLGAAIAAVSSARIAIHRTMYDGMAPLLPWRPSMAMK